MGAQFRSVTVMRSVLSRAYQVAQKWFFQTATLLGFLLRPRKIAPTVGDEW